MRLPTCLLCLESTCLQLRDWIAPMLPLRYRKTVFVAFAAAVTLAGCSTEPGTMQNWKPKEFRSIFHGKTIESGRFSPDGKVIVFAVRDDTSSRLYTVNADGTNLVPLSADKNWDYHPAFSPDGTRIVFGSRRDWSKERGGPGNVCIMKADGTDRVFLTTSDGHEYNPVFSPDGRKIFFLRADTFRSYSPIVQPYWHDIDIYSINVDGSGLTQLSYQRFRRISDMSILPDGQTVLAHIGESKSAYSVWMIPVENAGQRKPVCPEFVKGKRSGSFFIDGHLGSQSPTCGALGYPHISTDGKWILFQSMIGELFVMDVAANRATRVLKLNTAIKYASFSGDASQIVFSTYVLGLLIDGAPHLWVVNRDGSNGRNVLNAGLEFSYLTTPRGAATPPPSTYRR